MASPTKSKPVPKWVIDLHGIREVLTTQSGAAKTKVVNAIQSGEMLILRSVSDELKSAFPDLWTSFNEIRPKKYVHSNIKIAALVAVMQETHGTSVWGGVPNYEHFEAVAMARGQKCKLVSAGKALDHCRKIALHLNIPESDIIGITKI